MTDRIDPSNWPSPRGPWREVSDFSRVYDHGRWWCTNAAGHPRHAGYPDPDLHVPWDECHGPEAMLTEVRDEQSGDFLDLTTYIAAPFRFGEDRRSVDTSTRLVIETGHEDGETALARLSLSLSDALRLARSINTLVDQIAVPRPPSD